MISEEGVADDPEKIKAMVHWPKPCNIKKVRWFLGLTGYYWRFFKTYGVIERALIDMLKKDQFMWGEAAQKSFENLKSAMVTVLVLILPDFNRPIILESDASRTGLGDVLMQEQRLIAYYSCTLSYREKRG